MKDRNIQTQKRLRDEEANRSVLKEVNADQYKPEGMYAGEYEPDEWNAGEAASDEWSAGETAPDDMENELRPWMKAALFVALPVLAALICSVLWHFTQPDRHLSGGQPDTTGQVTEQPPSSAGQEKEAPSASAGQEKEAPSASAGQEKEVPSASAGQGEEVPPSLAGQEKEAPTASAGQEEEAPSASAGQGEEAPSASAGQEKEAPTASAGQEKEAPSASAGQEKEAPSASAGQEEEAQLQSMADGNVVMRFDEVQENVTAKDFVNLRVIPSTQNAVKIVAQAKNGDVLVRTGINEDTGWSRVEKDGEILYAVSSYLTTDLSYVTPAKTTDPNRVGTRDGRIIVFTDCDDWVSPKEYVNLRTEPSTSEGEATVDCRLDYGEKAHRTGYSADSGWSRVEYNGKVLYVVSSLVSVQ